MGAPHGRVYSGTDLADGELHPLGPGLAAVFTQRAPGGETANEDCCALLPYDERSGLIVVADGAGGLPAGEKAAELTVAALRQSVRQAARRGVELRAAVLDGIEQAARRVTAMGVGAATTVAVAEVTGRKVRTYHVGDSQIMLIGRMGKVKLATKCHSPTGYAVEAGLLDPKAALVHSQRHLVSNLVGLSGMCIELGPAIDLSPHDTLLVASDGLFDNLRADEIAEACRAGQLLALSNALREECEARMLGSKPPCKPDDLTFVAWRRRASA